MPTTINASNTSGGAIITPDGSGVLELQSGGVTGLTVSGANVTVAGTLTATGGLAALTSPVSVIGNASAGAEIRLPEDTDNGANYVAIKAPNALAANLTFTLPTADGTNGQFIRTDGAGQLSFATVSPGGTTGQIQFNNAGVFGGVTAVPVANGGTGATTLTGVVKGNGTSAFTTGTVSVSEGGTGATTLTANAVLIGNGTSAVTAVAPGTTGNILTSNGTVWTSAAPAGTNIQQFTSSGIWTKPTGANFVVVEIYGAGGGGASGNRTSSTQSGEGGLGGGGGAYRSVVYPASDLPASVTITIGAGGAGGPSRTTNGNGFNGSNGGSTTFGSFLFAGGGGGGSNANSSAAGAGGGATSSANGNTGGSGTGLVTNLDDGKTGPAYYGGAGGALYNSSTPANNPALNSVYGGGGGGAGSGRSNGGIQYAASAGGGPYNTTNTGSGQSVGGDAAGFRMGGAGGNSDNSQTTVTGGAGGIAGGGGGGSGAINSVTSGAGGTGGSGFARITTF